MRITFSPLSIPKAMLMLVILSAASANARNLLVITDMEPDDRIALILLAASSPEAISLVGITGLHTGRKAALARQLMSQLGLSNVPVVQGSGGIPSSYDNFGSSRAALTYQGEGVGLLPAAQLQSLSQNESRSSDDLQIEIRSLLQTANNVEVVLLAPATDLVLALDSDPALIKSLKHIHMMGGWSESRGSEGESLRRTTYNWNMDAQSAARLVRMQDVPITLYSTHMIKRVFSGGGVNKDSFPEIIELMENKATRSRWAESFFIAARSWDANVLEQIPYLVPVIGEHAGRQFTPADPVVVLGLSNPEIVTRLRSIDIRIELGNRDPERGYNVVVTDNSASNIRSIESIDTRAFSESATALITQIDDSPH